MVGGCGVDKLQSLLTRTLQSMIGLGREDAGGISPIYRGLGVSPIKTIAASARARGFVKHLIFADIYVTSLGHPLGLVI